MSSGTSCFGVGIERFSLIGTPIEWKQKESPLTEEKKEKVIVIAGPTAGGKSALACLLAERMNGEVISADSMQVYIGMDIGTAKISKAERKKIPHHLLDVRAIHEPYNVVDFYHEATHHCQEILAKGKVPIVAGGSGFYIHTLLYGPPEGPPSVPAVRKRLEEEMNRIGPHALYERLCQLDLAYAETITHNDKHKIIRALEIIELTGTKVSSHAWKSRRTPSRYNFRCWLVNRPRATLYQRIERRCEKMIAQGLLEETAYLKQAGIYQNSSAAQAIGYRQSLDFLGGPQTVERYRLFVEEFKKASRHYLKRQMTWFRREAFFHWIDLDLHDPETAVDMIQRDYDLS